jgi:hypothetical protein
MVKNMPAWPAFAGLLLLIAAFLIFLAYGGVF